MQLIPVYNIMKKMVTYDNKTVTIGILLQKQTKKLNNMQIFSLYLKYIDIIYII